MTTPALTVQGIGMPLIGGYHPYGLASILTGLDSNRLLFHLRISVTERCECEKVSRRIKKALDVFTRIRNLIMVTTRSADKRKLSSVKSSNALSKIELRDNGVYIAAEDHSSELERKKLQNLFCRT
ncbi:hypothetical protein TNCV_1037041 [Trichonephila clavipes]|nr:hypothetical protein TNCV_1037041 [Trichonephila clavipes]